MTEEEQTKIEEAQETTSTSETEEAPKPKTRKKRVRKPRFEELEGLVSEMKVFSELIGELSTEYIHAVYGASQSGKTTLLLQLLYEVSHRTGRPTLLYDTEGGARRFVDEWEPVYRKMYPLAQVHVRLRRNYKAILRDHGHTVQTAMSGDKAKSDAAKMKTGGKMTLKRVGEADPSPLMEAVLQEKYAMIVYDSFTEPMTFFGADQQNFPARSTAWNLWFIEAMSISDTGNCVVFGVHHMTQNPADPYAREMMSGGKATRHVSKIQLHVKKFAAKGISNYRKVALVRHFCKPPDVYVNYVKLTDNGYVDVTEEELERDRARR